jgi:carboxyl-terminal processing protease
MAVADTTKFYTGMGRVVYSGGGITPDVFIPLDTSYFNPFFNEMNGHLPQFLSRWMEQHKGGLPTDANEFEQNYKVGDDIIAALADYAIKQGAKRDEKQLLQSKNELKLRLKSRMARVLFGDTVQYKVINSDDPAIEKALQLIKSGASLK